MSQLEIVPSTSVEAVEYWRAFLTGRPEIASRDPVLHARVFLELPAADKDRYHAFKIAGKVAGTVRLGRWDLTEDPHAITFFSMTPEARELAVEAIGLASATLRKRGGGRIVAGFRSGYLEAFERAGFQKTFSRMTMRAELRRPAKGSRFLHPQEEDAAELASFFEQAYEGHLEQQHGMHVGTPADWLAYTTGLVSGCLRPCSWLARDSTGIRGVCLVTLGTDGPVIDELGVRKDVRGAGLGGELASASMDSLLEAGHSRLSLDVTVGNETAIRLYESLGFREAGERLIGAVLGS